MWFAMQMLNEMDEMEAPTIIQSTKALACVFSALGDPIRLKLVVMLCTGEAFSITQLTANTHISRQGVTKHLRVLASAGLVSDLKMGRERVWRFDPAQIGEVRRTLEIIGKQWDESLGRIKLIAESVPVELGQLTESE
jgi:DNA-binding transcriptional ArsR family regulator